MITAISILAVLAGVLLIAATVFAVLFFREKKKGTEGTERADKVKIVDGVRYSRDDSVFENGESKITLNQGDFVLAKGKTYTAQKNGELLPGTYTLLAANNAETSFKLRAGGLVRDYRHGDTLVLADGEQICAVSHTVILR